ncbi:MAG: hypothetical protein COS89_01905 [Deltaproteobacteria bacterium CG07_land_8_20_14_0_80_38_7]|nr:MAG: hypothetical protein COS89_01905 [Deltaproteobacteria bacterium CG07_land_8_20_14_0_80_38_7]
MKKIKLLLLIFGFFLCITNSYAGDKSEIQIYDKKNISDISDFKILKNNWITKKIDQVLWGVATSNMHGQDNHEIILLERNAVRLYRIDGDKNISLITSYEWDSSLRGYRLYTMDLDNDGIEELVISGSAFGIPSSLILKIIDEKFSVLAKDIRRSLRVIEFDDLNINKNIKPKILAGQSWSSEAFFSGPIYSLTLNGNSIKQGKKIKLPKRIGIYDFAIIPDNENDNIYEPQEVVILDGYSYLQILGKKKKRYKKIWSSSEKFGGSQNLIPAVERRPLGIANDGYVIIDREPKVILFNNEQYVVTLWHDLPLKNVIGQDPFIKTSRLVVFKKDQVLGYIKAFQTEDIQGYVSDFSIDFPDNINQCLSANDQKKKNIITDCVFQLLVAVQPDTSAFFNTANSLLLSYTLPLNK